MKITNLVQLSSIAGLALALTISPARAEVQTKGAATQLMPAKSLRAVDRAQFTAERHVAACSECRDTYANAVERSSKGTQLEQKVVATHACPGCETRIVARGHGKMQAQQRVHVKGDCAAKDAACCAAKKDAGM